MRRIMICCFAFLIGISCAVGCGRTGAGTEEAVSAQDGRTDAEEEADWVEAGEPEGEEGESGRAEAGKAEPAREETAKAEDGEAKDGMTASDGNGTDGKAADRNQGGNAGKAPGAAENAASSETGTKEAGDKDRPNIQGALSVEGTQLVDSEGRPVQLKGISTHGLAWYPQYVNRECFRQLKEEWGMDVIRLAMYTAESGGYCTDGNQEDLKALVRDGVEYATDCGLYVIIDWHILSDGNPNTHLEEARAFFREMSEAYVDYDNVIYEICNEPNGGVSWAEIKSYAEQVIATIREKDGDGIILVGTPNWSQYVDQAAADPITGYDNIMYTLHFYAATHKDSLRDAMVQAIADGLPIFVSEYGICDASGNGGIDMAQADEWVRVMDEQGISYVAWNLSDKAEASAILKNGCGRTSGLSQEDLSESGRWLLKMLGGEGSAERESGGTGTVLEEAGRSPGSRDGKDGEAAMENGTVQIPGGTSGAADAGQSGAGNVPPQMPESTGGSIQAPELQGLDDLTVESRVVNSWEQNNESYYQYEVTITNSADTARDGWRITLTFGGDIALQDGWNGNYQAEGNMLTITQMDYNGYLEAGGSVGGIGFILKIAP